MRSVSVRLVACASVALLTACSSGGGDDSVDPVSLASRADVLREIGTFADMRRGPLMQPAASSAQTRRGGSLMSPSASGQARGSQGKGYAPAAQETVPCDSGSVTHESFTGAARNYPLFGVTPPSTDYDVAEWRDCTQTYDASWTETNDGRVETGWSGSATASYSYEVLGSGSTPYRYVLTDSSDGSRYATQLLGRTEYRDVGSVWQSREHMSAKAQFPWVGRDFSVTAIVGEDGNPLVVTEDYSVNTFAVDGPITYSTTFCEGGRVEFTTVEPMTFGSDDSGTFVNGGQVVIEAGGRSVTVTFHNDGRATYQFDGGASGTIFRDEMPFESECLLPD